MEIKHPSGKVVNIRLEKMTAMEGWEIQRRFIEFAMSKDPAFRKEYTMEVLSFAKVMVGSEQELPLSTGALIDNHLGSWENIREVFNGVLLDNGIDPDTHGDREDYWSSAGGQIAAAFISETIRLMEPLVSGATPQKG